MPADMTKLTDAWIAEQIEICEQVAADPDAFIFEHLVAARTGYPLVLREVLRLRKLEASWQHATDSWKAEEQSWREQMDELHKDMALLAEVFERSI